MNIVISSGHGLHVPGARDIIDEVTEARRVTDWVAAILRSAGALSSVFHDNTSRNQRDNINTIVRHHNGQIRDLDVSVHFNAVAGGTRDAGIGVEALYRVGNAQTRELAGRVAKAISKASGLILRHPRSKVPGAVARNDLGFLNNTNAYAILIEVCFVNSRTDVRLYQQHFEAICQAIANSLIGGMAMNFDVNVNVNGTLSRNAGVIINDRTFVPLAFIAESLGATVRWDEVSRTASIDGGAGVNLETLFTNATPDQWRQIAAILQGR